MVVIDPFLITYIHYISTFTSLMYLFHLLFLKILFLYLSFTHFVEPMEHHLFLRDHGHRARYHELTYFHLFAIYLINLVWITSLGSMDLK